MLSLPTLTWNQDWEDLKSTPRRHLPVQMRVRGQRQNGLASTDGPQQAMYMRTDAWYIW
jgi:hypothetical protein